MKKILLLFVILSLTTVCKAQNAKQTADGNYTAINGNQAADSAKATGKTFTDHKGEKFEVSISPKGKLFYLRTSKAGNQYKVYLKL